MICRSSRPISIISKAPIRPAMPLPWHSSQPSASMTVSPRNSCGRERSANFSSVSVTFLLQCGQRRPGMRWEIIRRANPPEGRERYPCPSNGAARTLHSPCEASTGRGVPSARHVRRFPPSPVADFPDHQNIRILADDRAEAFFEGEPCFLFTWICVTPSIRYSTGSSIEMIFTEGSFRSRSAA